MRQAEAELNAEKSDVHHQDRPARHQRPMALPLGAGRLLELYSLSRLSDSHGIHSLSGEFSLAGPAFVIYLTRKNPRAASNGHARVEQVSTIVAETHSSRLIGPMTWHTVSHRHCALVGV